MATGGQSEGDIEGHIPDSVAGSTDLFELKCQPCHEGGKIRKAVGICIDCQDPLCRKCFKRLNIHVHKPSRNHQLLDNQQMLQSQVKIQRKDTCTQKCSFHDEKIIKYYCKEHGQLGCSVCLKLDHRTCKSVQYIPEAATNLENNEEFKEAENLLSSALKLCKKVSAIGNVKESIETSCATALHDVETYRSKVNGALDKIKAEIVEKAETMKTRALDKITTITDKYQKAQRELQEFQTRTEALRRSHQNCDLYTDMLKMKDTLELLKDELTEVERGMLHLDTTLRFIPNLKCLNMLRTPEIFGNLKGLQGLQVQAELLPEINAQCSAVTGCTLLSGTTLVIVDWNNSDIKEVDVKQNKVISQLKLLSYPWDVCTIKPHQVAVTLVKEKKISFVKVDGNMSVDRSINVNGGCRGLDFKKDKLAVSFHSPAKVQVMTLQGTVLHEITTDQRGQALFSSPFYVNFDQTGTSIFVSNHASHSVVRVELDGTLIATYTDSKLKNPLGTVLGSDGNVYVCGWNSHNIHQLSPDCKKLRVLLGQFDGIKQPRSISYNETEDKFYVGSESSKIQAYKAFRESK